MGLLRNPIFVLSGVFLLKGFLLRGAELMRIKVLVFACMVFLLAAVQGCDAAKGNSAINFTTKYQAVFLDNGQVFFGRLENSGSRFPVLMDVFYIQRVGVKAQDKAKQSGEVRTILVKRGNELHGPDRMHLNSEHIVLIEPVGLGSRIYDLINENMDVVAP